MIRTILIEDERMIAEEFRRILEKCPSGTEWLGCFATVKESIQWLSENDPPDLIFSDVQLPDGLSFEIFNSTHIRTPVIFITGYDQFMMNAFEHNGIGYLLKPVDERDLQKALAKFKTLEKHFINYHSFLNGFRRKGRSRLIVRKGLENIALRTEDIVLIYTEEKLVFAINKDGRKFIVDHTLADLEDDLDNSLFFRVNRQYIVNISFIKSYRTYEKVKLQVDLCLPEFNRPIVISQEMAPLFRRWMSES